MQTKKALPQSRGNGKLGKNRISFRWFEAGLALLGGAAFAAVGPWREAFETLPGIPVAGTFVLFMAPGALLARWTLGERFSGAALLPAGFVISTSVFALLGVPMLVLQTGLEAYLRVSGVVVALSLLAALAALLRPPRREQRSGETVPDRGGLLWVPFVALAAVLVYVCRVNAPSFIGDIWVYLSWIREFLDGQRLAFEEPYFGDAVGLSRARINGWLLEQAAFSRISGVEPVD